MSVIAVVGAKGAPGVTTTAVAFAAVWPGEVILAECDPAGGDLPFRLRAADGGALSRACGMVSLASAARGGQAAEAIGQHLQLVDGGLPVLVGPASEAQTAAMTVTWPAVATSLGAAPGDVIADCGRLSETTAIWPILEVASLVVLVCRDTVESVAHSRAALEVLLGRLSATVTVVPIGAASAVTEVRDALRGLGEVDVVGPLAVDAGAAAALAGAWSRRLDRSPLVVSARLVVRALVARTSSSLDRGAAEAAGGGARRAAAGVMS